MTGWSSSRTSAWIVIDGLRRSKGTDKVDGYFLANRSLPWWAVGLSVMATQMSAVTMVGTTGQAYLTGLRFIQFYFGLPLAMIILSLTVVPFFTRARVYTAYEYLERRFDVRVRSLASFLFLMGRAASLGVTLAAPSVVMSAILGWTLPVTVLAICVPMIVYTTIGGVQAVAWTDVKQMFVVVGGMSAAVAILIYGILQHVSFGQALHLAGATGRLNAIDFKFSLTETYTFWSGMIGGLFLMLSYFGCDQSQVQRYLTAKSIDEARHSLLMSAYVKIPLQLLILTSGVLVFVFYLFQTPPMLFNRVYDAQVASSPQARRVRGAPAGVRRRDRRPRDGGRARRPRRVPGQRRAREGHSSEGDGGRQAGDRRRALQRRQLRVSDLHHDAHADRAGRPDDRRDLRRGDVGERRRAERARDGDDHRLLPPALRHQRASDRHYLLVSKLATIFWGLFACVVAMYAANQGSLIEVVNRYGSFFYGSLLGVFILAILTRRATARGAFWGLIAGMAVVLTVALHAAVDCLPLAQPDRRRRRGRRRHGDQLHAARAAGDSLEDRPRQRRSTLNSRNPQRNGALRVLRSLRSTSSASVGNGLQTTIFVIRCAVCAALQPHTPRGHGHKRTSRRRPWTNSLRNATVHSGSCLASDGATVPGTTDAAHGGTETILLVEDEDLVRGFVVRVLTAKGYAVHAMPNPARAIEFAEAWQGTIDLVLTDVVLPDMSGREMVTRLQQRRPQGKVLYMSGYDDIAIVNLGVIEEGTAFLPKPFTGEAVAENSAKCSQPIRL